MRGNFYPSLLFMGVSLVVASANAEMDLQKTYQAGESITAGLFEPVCFKEAGAADIKAMVGFNIGLREDIQTSESGVPLKKRWLPNLRMKPNFYTLEREGNGNPHMPYSLERIQQLLKSLEGSTIQMPLALITSVIDPRSLETKITYKVMVGAEGFFCDRYQTTEEDFEKIGLGKKASGESHGHGQGHGQGHGHGHGHEHGQTPAQNAPPAQIPQENRIEDLAPGVQWWAF